jgi:SAM-dependent methyltransferase
MNSAEKSFGVPTVSERDAESVREFFNGWSLYRRIVDNDYLYHQSVREALALWLDAWVNQVNRPFSFLDLGCGDAEFSSGILKGRPLRSYTGIDLSPVALELAANNTRELLAPCRLEAGDFITSVATLPESYDIIYIGLSLHHLSRLEKEYFFGELRRKLQPGGFLLVFDPVLTPGETRDSYMGRWVDNAQWSWSALSVEEIESAVQHVTTSDFPEEIGTLNRMAVNTGFQPAEILFTDRSDFYALMAFRGA